MANKSALWLSFLWMTFVAPHLALAAGPREWLEILPPGITDKAVPVRPEIVASRRIALHLDALTLADGADGGPRLPLPDGAVYEMVRTGLERRGPDGFAWRGKVLVPGHPDGSATLTAMNGTVAGVISLPDSLYEILPMPDGDHLLLEIDPGRFPACGGAVIPPLTRRATQAPAEAPAEAGGKATTRIDLLIVYTAGAVSAAGSERTLRVRLQNAVDAANTAFLNSEIDAHVNLVHVAQIPYTETGTAGTDLRWLRVDPAVANLRRTWGADMVSMMVGRMTDACGIGYLMSEGDVSPIFAPFAYTVVDLRCAVSNYTLAHELGHNLAANHDPGNGPSADQAAFPYAFGHYVDGSFRTVMSYSTECALSCPRVNFFSHPGLTYNGQPIGIPDQRDNHRAINATRDVVGAFQAAQPCRPGPNNLCLVRNRFKVELVWDNQFDNSSGLGTAIPRTDLAGFFSFGDPSNVELMVKVLDFGDVVKVFYGQLTNLRFTLIVTDTHTGTSRVYGNTTGECGAIDQSAFAGAVGRSLTPDKAGPCRPGAGTLCLMGNRFQVTAEWRNPGDGSGGQAGAVPLSNLTGAFWFGDRNNLEVMAKILDLGGRIDFFYGTLSDLEYTLTVTDTATGAVKTYRNPAGTYCGGLDDAAF
jgi:hypothetical protein